MPGVQNGDYRLSVQARGYAGYFGDTDLHVEGQPVHGLDVKLDVGATVRGRVSGLEADRLGDVTVEAQGPGFHGFGGVGVEAPAPTDREPRGRDLTVWRRSRIRQARAARPIDPGATEAALDRVFEPGLVLGTRRASHEPVRGPRSTSRAGAWSTAASTRPTTTGLRDRRLGPGEYDVRLRHWQTGLPTIRRSA
jgi:hypothetical protein